MISRIENLEVVGPGLAFWGLGQVGVVIKGPDGVLFIDPYLTDSNGEGGRIERTSPPPLAPGEITNADAVLLTHDHIDHTDPATILPMAESSPDAKFTAPHTSRNTLMKAGLEAGRITVPAVGEAFEAAGAKVTAIPSAHTGLEYEPGRGHPYLGYVIEWNGVVVYHAGDTVIYDGLIGTLSGWDIDIAFIPINGRDYFRTARGVIGNTDFREAAELAEALDIGLVVPTHYDLIVGNTEDPGNFVSYLHRLDPARRHKTLCPGELLYFAKEGG